MPKTYEMTPRDYNGNVGRHRCSGKWYPVIKEVAQSTGPPGKTRLELKRYLVEELRGRIPEFAVGINVVGTVVGKQSVPDVCLMEPLDPSIDIKKLARYIAAVHYNHLYLLGQ